MAGILHSNKTYTIWDYIRIPLVVCPSYTLIKAINKIINALVPSFQVLVTAKFIDTALIIFKDNTQYTKIWIPLLLLVAIVLYSYLNWSFMSYINLKFEMRMNQIFRTAIVEKRSKLEYCHVENNDSWDLITRTCGDPAGRVSGGLDNILGAVELVVRVISILIILITQVWWAGLAIIAISIPLFIIAFKGGKESYQAHKEAEKYNRRAGYLHGVLSGRENIEERALFGYTDAVNQQWYEKYEVARKINLKVNLKNFIRMKSSSLITVFISASIIVILLIPLSNGEITPGLFMGLVTATLGLVQMMSWQFSYITQQFANNREYLKDLTAFMALSETEGALDQPANHICFDSIEFKHVFFKYPDTEQFILKDFSLKLEKNLHYAFVGVNGAGKTTITKLLTGMYSGFDGDILINGKDIRSYKLAELKALFAVVYQDFAKYYIPLEDNVALGNVLDKDNEKIEEAVSLIGLSSAVDKLSQGIKTPLGKIYEDGVDLSGGEWQRVAIARTLCNPAEVRILDEPTAALDPVAESKVYEMFSKISMGKSTIFITHRLGAARLADEIVVIDNGCVAEKGNHEALMKLGGIYSEMFESQRSWYQ